MKKIAIIIPAYNEEKRIGPTLEEYGKFFTKLKKEKIIDSKIIIVINNTNDRTEEIVRKYVKKYKLISYLNLRKGGKGFAITEGFKEVLKNTNMNFIGFVDADMATSPETFYDLIKNINGWDGIIASRYINGAVVNPKQSVQRIIVSRMFNWLIKILFSMKYHDTQCGAKLFTRNAIKKITPLLGITQWAFDVDLLYKLKKLGYKIKEHPTFWSDKEYSKINFMKAGPKMFTAIVRLRLLESPFNRLIYPLLRLNDLIKNKIKS